MEQKEEKCCNGDIVEARAIPVLEDWTDPYYLCETYLNTDPRCELCIGMQQGGRIFRSHEEILSRRRGITIFCAAHGKNSAANVNETSAANVDFTSAANVNDENNILDDNNSEKNHGAQNKSAQNSEIIDMETVDFDDVDEE